MENNVFFQQLPGVKVRFANPKFDTETKVYSVGVEFSAETPDLYLHGMNIRFMYDSSQLKFKCFDDFIPGYARFSPNPPYVNSGTPASGPLFGWNYPAVFVNGAIMQNNPDTITLLQVDSWTELFRVHFTLPTIPPLSNFAPSIVWDKKDNAGLLFGDGVTITVFDTNNPLYSTPTREVCEHFNWEANVPCAIPQLGKPKPTQSNIYFIP